MTTLLEREQLETLERPVEEEEKASRGPWLAIAAAVIAVVIGVVALFLLRGGDEGVEVDFNATSSYMPDGASELNGILTDPAVPLPAPISVYVPQGATELQTALAEPNIDFDMPSTYVPQGGTELPTALAEKSADSLRYR